MFEKKKQGFFTREKNFHTKKLFYKLTMTLPASDFMTEKNYFDFAFFAFFSGFYYFKSA